MANSPDDLSAISKKILEIVSTAPDTPDIAGETAKILEIAKVDGRLDQERALELAAQRSKGMLLPQLTGRTAFMNLEVNCLPGVFTVREETELLGWTAVKKLQALAAANPDAGLRVIDMGSGSGNLTCGIANAVPKARFWSLDIDPACNALTQSNVQRHGLSDRVEIHQGDLFGPLAGLEMEGTIDVVVCNPPYIASVRLEKDRAYLVEHEPRAAFDGGPFGINIQMRLTKEALPFLKPGGWLLFEFGVGQDRQVKQLVERAGGYDIADFACNDKGEARVSINRKRM